MCGICGIVSSSSKDMRPDISNMMDRVAHRGPDGKGLWQHESMKVALGHVRLSIVDLSEGGAQPMHHSSNLHCVVNGEIYNYPTLKGCLEKEYQSQFNSQCDSEVIMQGYHAQGPDFFKKLNGMFAFALYDAHKDLIYLVRDRLGIKPLYYTIHNHQLIFSSEIKGLFGAIPDTSWNIDVSGLSQYMTYQTCLEDRTLFENIKLLEPGSVLTIDVQNISSINKQTIFEMRSKPNQACDFDAAVIDYKQTFQESVNRHLLSDVPVASYLSSGFDSSTVTVQAARQKSEAHTSYTGWFNIEGGWYDETEAAKTVMDEINGNHERVCISSDDLARELDNLIDSLDEPKMGIGAFPQYIVAKEVAKKFKVVLTGHGGDELFSGYPVFKVANNNSFQNLNLTEFIHSVYFQLSRLQGKFSKEYGRYLPVLWSTAKQKKLLKRNSAPLTPWADLEKFQNQFSSSVEKVFHTYLKVYLNGLLVVEDKISMARSLESRTPMLDNELLNLSLSIPQSIKMNNNELKAIIKQASRTQLPKEFYNQPKRGFPTPLSAWLRGPLKNLMEHRLLANDSYLNVIFKEEETRSIVNGFCNSPLRFARPLDEIQSHRMWQLLSLESWLRVWSERYNVSLRLP